MPSRRDDGLLSNPKSNSRQRASGKPSRQGAAVNRAGKSGGGIPQPKRKSPTVRTGKFLDYRKGGNR